MKPKKYFITYGTKEFNLQKKQIIYLTKKSKQFDTCIPFSFSDLDINFVKKYYTILNNKRGGGFWIWKHKIIQQLLKKINENDLIVYCDAASSYNPLGYKRLNEYFEIINSSKYSILQFQTHHIEEHYTIKEIFEYFGCNGNNNITKTGHLQANLIIIKRNKQSLEYFKEYEKILSFDRHLITDFYNQCNQIKEFIENRHDQSIFSVLSKTLGIEIIKGDETYFKNKPDEQYEYPFLSVRKKSRTRKEKLIEEVKYYTNNTKTIYF